MDPSCKKFLSRYPELQYDHDRGKIKCSLSGHEMPCRVDVLKSYVGGKKFAKLKTERDFNFRHLEPFLVPSKKRKYQLFCALTNRYVNRKPDEVKSHVDGRRYTMAMEKYNAGELVLFEERVGKPVDKKLGHKVKDKEEQGDDEDDERSVLQSVNDKTICTAEKDLPGGGFWAPNSDDDSETSPSNGEEGENYPATDVPTQADEVSNRSLGRKRKRKGLTPVGCSSKRKKPKQHRLLNTKDQ